MAFAKAYKEEITLAYYCCNVALTIAFFIFGTIYLWHRDRKDQQRESWRKLAETSKSEYSKLKTAKIPSKISNVKDTFGNIQIHEKITGLDVLRYMINDDSYTDCFKTSELDALREDLNSIFQLLNNCASFILLGTVPDNIRAELEIMVTELGKITLPFYKGMERQTILKCLKHFGGKPTKSTEKRVREIDTRLNTGTLQYIQYFRFCKYGTASDDLAKSTSMRSSTVNISGNYTECTKLRLQFNVSVRNPLQNERFTFLKKLQKDLQDEKYSSDFARELREHFKNPKYTDKIDSVDNDKLVLVKALHEVRVYIVLILNESQELDAINQNIQMLQEVYKNATKINVVEESVRGICERFKCDLSILQKSEDQYHQSETFKRQLEEQHLTLCDLISNKTNTDPNPLNSTEEKQEQVVIITDV